MSKWTLSGDTFDSVHHGVTIYVGWVCPFRRPLHTGTPSCMTQPWFTWSRMKRKKKIINEWFCNITHSSVGSGMSQKHVALSHVEYRWVCCWRIKQERKWLSMFIIVKLKTLQLQITYQTFTVTEPLFQKIESMKTNISFSDDKFPQILIFYWVSRWSAACRGLMPCSKTFHSKKQLLNSLLSLSTKWPCSLFHSLFHSAMNELEAQFDNYLETKNVNEQEKCEDPHLLKKHPPGSQKTDSHLNVSAHCVNGKVAMWKGHPPRKKNQLIRNPFDPLINSLNLTLDRRDLRKLIRGQLHLYSINSITMTKWKDNWKLCGESHVKVIDHIL